MSIIIVVGVLALIGSLFDSDDNKKSKSAMVDLRASVTFTGTQFVITNNDSFSWNDCKLEVNPKTFSSGFIYKAGNVGAGSTYSVGALQFANDEGQRFNPITYKPTSMSIACKTPEGNGFYYGGWN